MHPVTSRKYIDDKSLQGSLFHATSDGAQTSVHFPRWRSQNQRHDRIAGNFDVLERAKNMDLPVRSIDICITNEKKKCIYSRISENNAGATGIFYGKLCLAILTGDATLKNKALQLYITIDIEEIRTNSP